LRENNILFLSIAEQHSRNQIETRIARIGNLPNETAFICAKREIGMFDLRTKSLQNSLILNDSSAEQPSGFENEYSATRAWLIKLDWNISSAGPAALRPCGPAF
jgi:hypothetical protein